MRAEKNTRKRINIRNDNKQYFISLDTNWLYGGIKDSDENYFIFYGKNNAETIDIQTAKWLFDDQIAHLKFPDAAFL
jgi:hypothetical protein